MRVNRALRHQIPTVVDTVLQPSGKVLAWREKVVNKRTGKWLGPFIMDSFHQNKKLVFVREKDGVVKKFGLAQLRMYHDPIPTSYSFLTEINDRMAYFCKP